MSILSMDTGGIHKTFVKKRIEPTSSIIYKAKKNAKLSPGLAILSIAVQYLCHFIDFKIVQHDQKK